MGGHLRQFREFAVSRSSRVFAAVVSNKVESVQLHCATTGGTGFHCCQ